ncbi:MAG TPA: SDR family oxidoreductase [Vicinamibacteria bacterium]|nr:SDR family oxidoreductase [Vicinamibacteria bacterium]
MRILVTGAGGLLGGRLASVLAERFDVVAAFRESPPPEGLHAMRLDLLSGPTLEAALDRVRPDAVVHAAAMADPDRCEADPALAERVNVGGAEVIARWCGARDARLVAISTDLVFSGESSFSREEDATSPILAYGRTKLRAEHAILAACPGAAVARVTLVGGRGHGPRKTATEAIASALREGSSLRLYTDQFRTPIDDRSVAEGLVQTLVRGLSGLVHLGGPERLSRFALGQRVARILSLPDSLLVPVSTEEFPPRAPRPRDASLDSTRARERLGWAPRDLDTVIRESRGGGAGATRG